MYVHTAPTDAASKLSRQHVCGDGQTFSSRQEQQQYTTQQKLAAVPALVQLLRKNKGEVNVDVREAGPGAGLGLFASKAIKKGGVIMSFPTDLGFVGKAGQNGVLDFLLDYAADMKDPSSPRALMWATVPCPCELRHLLTFPQQYLPLLQHKQLEEWLGRGLHHDLNLFTSYHAPQLQAAGLTHDDLVHALGLIGTRTFAVPDDDDSSSSSSSKSSHQTTSYYALPLIDLANHHNACPHFNALKPCRFDASRQCVYFTAGADIAAGEEVCLYYGFLLPDRALLEYGFLPGQQPQLQQPEQQLIQQALYSPGTSTPSAPSAGIGLETAAFAASGAAVMAEAAVLDAAEAVAMAANAMMAEEMTSPGVAASQEAMLPAVETDIPSTSEAAAAPAEARVPGPQQEAVSGPAESSLADEAGEAPQLFGIDRHDFDAEGVLLMKLMEVPEPFQGACSSDIRQRIQVLQQLQARLQAGDEVAAAVVRLGPAAGDEDGVFLQQVLQWWRLRQAAVAAELARLVQQLPAHS